MRPRNLFTYCARPKRMRFQPTPTHAYRSLTTTPYHTAAYRTTDAIDFFGIHYTFLMHLPASLPLLPYTILADRHCVLPALHLAALRLPTIHSVPLPTPVPDAPVPTAFPLYRHATLPSRHLPEPPPPFLTAALTRRCADANARGTRIWVWLIH